MTREADPWTLNNFKRVGASHMRSAELIFENVKEKGTSPVSPASAAYLAHVALECVMKAMLLFRGSCFRVEDLKMKQPKVHEALFKGKQGHSLRELAHHLHPSDIPNHSTASGVADPCWERLTSNERPYSLRYGAESLSHEQAREELERVSEIVERLIKGIPKLSATKKRRKVR